MEYDDDTAGPSSLCNEQVVAELGAHHAGEIYELSWLTFNGCKIIPGRSILRLDDFQSQLPNYFKLLAIFSVDNSYHVSVQQLETMYFDDSLAAFKVQEPHPPAFSILPLPPFFYNAPYYFLMEACEIDGIICFR
eukprot:Pompholyxophrys_punicea_v1_NODE_174_length_3018_cov_13.585893.p1 type:complete len:135 gc:universal NODE_174_length_3018_cov_13.585893:2526-2930(+)